MSDQDAPQVTGPVPSQSTLGSIVGSAPAPMPSPQSPGSPAEQRVLQDDPGNGGNGGGGGGGGGSRLMNIIKAVASIGSTALSGTPAGGRPSFLGGAANGARAEQAGESTQQAIKFRTFDDSVRAASLHNQDQELQLRTTEQNDAHQKAQDAQHDWDESHGIQYDEVPNTGSAVTDHLTAQTTATGSASIAPGTHLSADGKSILIPKPTSETQAGQLQKYNTFAPTYGLPSLPQGAQFVPGKYLDMLQNKLEGHSISGDVYNHDQLPGAIADLQSTRESLASKGGDPNVLKQVDGTLASMKTKLNVLDDHADQVADAASQRKQAEAKAGIDERGAQTRQTNDEKPQKATDPDWKPGVTASQKNKADLAENMVSNINSVNSILAKRPDLVGAIAGRYTSGEQMIGNNDPDISALGTAIHNIGMANNGIHGMKANEGVHDFERLTLNGFKNGPQAIAGALGESTKSVQTFIDAARPNTYKTSTAQGGAVKGMAPQQSAAPQGATGTAKASDGKTYYHDAKGNNLGLVQ